MRWTYQGLRNQLFNWLVYEPPIKEPLPYDFNRLKYEIRPGDVLLVEGRSRVSSVIRSVSQSPWTHAALYIGRLNDIENDELHTLLAEKSDAKPSTRLIIEDVLNTGTVLTPLTEYQHHHLRICRPIGIAPNDLQTVLEFAIRSVGQPYNVRQLFDLFRFFLPWSILPKRWGSSLFRTPDGAPESGVCSTLIAKAFSSVQFPILPFMLVTEENNVEMIQRNPYLFAPKDFDYSPYFDIIKYPLFNPEEPLPYYRRMPWARQGTWHHADGIFSSPPTSKKPQEATSQQKKDKDVPPATD